MWNQQTGHEVCRGQSARTPGGFTLLELIITISILTVATLCSVPLAVKISRQTRLSREAHVANTEIQKVVDDILSIPFDSITTVYPPGTQIALEGIQNSSIGVSYEDPAADPLKIQITLTWENADSITITRTFYTARTK